MKHLLFICAVSSVCSVLVQTARGQTSTHLKDLSSFKDPGKSWRMAGAVSADLVKKNVLNVTAGDGILVNLPDKKNNGIDLFTQAVYGDFDVELDYLMALGSNSGIYLHGRYEVQLEDTWGKTQFTSGTNGGIYERWDEHRPEGKKGFGGFAPRMNASRAPGLWQHLKVSFQAPAFDAAGKKIRPAKILSVELNGVIIHEDVELAGPTRGAVGTENAKGPLRIQGDHGAVAFRNIKVTEFDKPRAEENERGRRNRVYPMTVDAHASPVFRSFMDLADGTRVVHAVSVASDKKVHYTYDTDTGMILQVWRGDFLDATPMWFSRGDGSSRPMGAVLGFGNPVPAISRLTSAQSAWRTDTTGSGFRPKGYMLEKTGEPVFIYRTEGLVVRDASQALPNGEGIGRVITIENPGQNIYMRVAQGSSISEVEKGMYLVDNPSYFLKVDDSPGGKPVIRNVNGGKELLVPVKTNLRYSILF